jgi:hypothetical protein
MARWLLECARMRLQCASARGFGLAEVLIAATTLIVALAGLAHLAVAAALADRRAETLTLAAVYAQQKIELLIPRAALDPAVVASPPDALTRNADGNCEFLDAHGSVIATGSAAPAGAAFVRRWSVEPIVTAASIATALNVVVIDARPSGVDARSAAVVRRAS